MTMNFTADGVAVAIMDTSVLEDRRRVVDQIRSLRPPPQPESSRSSCRPSDIDIGIFPRPPAAHQPLVHRPAAPPPLPMWANQAKLSSPTSVLLSHRQWLRRSV